MMRNPGLTRIAIALGLTVAVAAAGCGGDSKKVTNPPPARELDSPLMGHLQTWPHRFDAAGTFPYHCAVHTFMTASVTVSASAPAGDTLASVDISGNTFTPGTLIIRVGGKVTWTNSDAVNHTVTSD
jgi:plastocyanin